MTSKSALAIACILILIVFILSCLYVIKNAEFFYVVDALYISALNLQVDHPTPDRFVINYIGKIIALFAKSYLLGFYVVLIPSIALILFIAGKSNASSSTDGSPTTADIFSSTDRILSVLKSKYLMILLPLISFTLTLIIFYIPMKGFIQPIDEFSYIFQGKILMQGRLYLDSPEPRQAYYSPQIINNGKWYSKYTIGYPLLLIPGIISGMPIIINALLAAGIVLLLQMLYQELFGADYKAIPAILAIISPMFIFTSSTLTPHAATAFFALLSTYLLFKAVKIQSFKLMLGSALSLGFLFQIRPVDGLLVSTSLLIAIITEFISKQRSFEFPMFIFLRSLGAVIGGTILGGVALAFVNYYQNGNPFLFSFLVFNPEEKFGFGAFGHTFFTAMWNLLFNIFRIDLWNFPFFLELSALALLLDKNKRFSFPWIIFVIYVLFFLGYYSEGGGSYGSRFLFVPCVFLLLSCARGIANLARWLPDTIRSGVFDRKVISDQFVELGLIFTLAMASLFVFYPKAWNQANSLNLEISGKYRALENKLPSDEKAIVFLSYIPMLFTCNSPELRDNTIKVLLLKPKVNVKLMETYRDRRPYCYIVDGRTGDMVLVPYPPDSAPQHVKALMLYYAGQNYMYQLGDVKNAKECIEESIKLLPNNLNAWFDLGFLFYLHKDYNEAEKVFNKYIQNFPESACYPAYYYLGRIAGIKGDRKKAIEYFDRFLKNDRKSPLAVKAISWKDYYK